MLCMVVTSSDKLLSQMRRGAIEYCVLALLVSEDRYGFSIIRTLSESDGLVTSEGTVYPLLNRLRSEGLVETYLRPSPEGPDRRYYRITKEGKAALGSFITQWDRFRNSVDALLGTR